MAEIIMAFAPLVFLIVYALKTRKMAESMILATLLAMVLLHRQHFLTGTIDAMYATLANSSYQFALCVIIGFGSMISLLQASVALVGGDDHRRFRRVRHHHHQGHNALRHRRGGTYRHWLSAVRADVKETGKPAEVPTASAGFLFFLLHTTRRADL